MEGHYIHEISYRGPWRGDGTDEPDEEDLVDFDTWEVTSPRELAAANTTPWATRDKTGPLDWTESELEDIIRESGHVYTTPFRAGQAKVPPTKVFFDGPPTNVAERPVHPAVREVRDAHILQQRDDDVLEECEGEVVATSIAAFHMVRHATKTNPDGSPVLRGVLDARQQNKFMTDFKYDGPTPEAVLQDATRTPMGEELFVASADLKSAYFQLPLDESARRHFGLRTSDGRVFRYKVVAMGAKFAAAALAAVITPALAAHREYVVILADDVLVRAPSRQLLKERFIAVLKSLADINLRLNLAKIQGGGNDLVFAGYHIAANRVAMTADRVAAMATWPEPSTRKKLETFIATARWLGKFVQGFETRVDPLTEALRRTKHKLTLTQIEREAFEGIKRALTDPAALATYNPHAPLIIYCDASDVATGAVLMQMQHDGTQAVVAYHSARLTRGQRNYDARTKELLAAMRVLTRYRDWAAMATSIIICTDHRSLQYIVSTNSQQNQRITRWQLFLSSFPITFRYVPAKHNVGADGLSRRYNAEDTCHEEARVALVSAESPQTAADMLSDDQREQLLKEQANDGHYREVIEFLRGECDVRQVSSATRARARTLSLDQHGLVVYTAQDGVHRLALPRGVVRDQLLQRMHVRLVHPGMHAMRAAIATDYYIYKARHVLNGFVAACEVCAQAKRHNAAPGVAEAAWRPQGRWLDLCADFATGLPDEDGHNAVLVIRDRLTRMTLLVPSVTSVTTAGLIRTLRSAVFRNFGFPLSLRTDAGSVFTSKLFAAFCQQNGINLSVALKGVHVPEAERAIGELRTKVRAATSGNGTGWLSRLPDIEFAMNAAVGRDGVNAFTRDRGYTPRLPHELPDPMVYASTRELQQTNTNAITPMVEQHHDDKVTSTTLADRGRTPNLIKVGGWACVNRKVFTPPGERGDNAKFAKTQFVFSEPYRVLSDEGHGNFKLALPPKSRVRPVFNDKWLKPFRPLT